MGSSELKDQEYTKLVSHSRLRPRSSITLVYTSSYLNSFGGLTKSDLESVCAFDGSTTFIRWTSGDNWTSPPCSCAITTAQRLKPSNHVLIQPMIRGTETCSSLANSSWSSHVELGVYHGLIYSSTHSFSMLLVLHACHLLFLVLLQTSDRCNVQWVVPRILLTGQFGQ